MASVTLVSVSHTVGDTKLLDGVSLHIPQGELLVVVGPSGSGKTTLIRVVAGLDSLTDGKLLFDDEDVSRLAVEKRDIGLVTQADTLFVTHKVRRNIGFPLWARSMRRKVVDKRVKAEARALDIEDVLDRWPQQLSAGHAQLAQIARAMVRVPRVLLLDEPMARLDAATRSRLRRELRELQRGYGVTTIYATNDPVEAMAMADRIVALERGVVRQIGRPEELYAAPADLHIAWLTGPISVVEAAVEADSDGFWLSGDGFCIRAWAPVLGRHRKVKVGLRPEHVRVSLGSAIRATVEAQSFENGREVTRLRLGSHVVAIEPQSLARGDEIGVEFEGCLVFAPSGELLATVS